MTITQMVQNRQQQRIGELAQKQQGKPHVNPYGTPGMSLNDAGDYRKMVPVDEGVVQQVKQIAFNHMKNGYGVSDGRTISYHSDCGTFNERLEQGHQSLRLSDADRETVNAVIQTVIPHDISPNAPVE